MKPLITGNKRFWLIIIAITLLAGVLSSPLPAQASLAAPARPDTDPVGLRWSQRTVNNRREVLLQWRQSNGGRATSSYTIMYRTAGGQQWSSLATVQPTADAHAMMAILGSELYETLRYDLRPSPDQPPLLPEQLYDLLLNNPELGQAAAEAYWQVGVVIGRAYVHGNVPATARYDYYVARSSQPQTPLFQPVCTSPTSIAFRPTNLKAALVVNIPAELGLLNSSRPFDAIERYEWDQYQQARRMHGRAFLVWDMLPDTPPPSDPLACSPAESLRVAGYNLYRRDALTPNQDWQQVNPQSDSGRSILVRPGLPADEQQNDFETYFFQEDILGQYPSASPNLLFGRHDYRVCVVDYFGQEHRCVTAPIEVRELDTPAAVQRPDVAIDAYHTAVSLRWNFADPAETSLPLRYFVTRSSDSSAPPDEWLNLTPNGTSLTSLVDTPPADTAFWYRVQVRDNAGNWSPLSAPVAGALYDRAPPSADLNPACGAYHWPLTYDDLANLSETPAQIAFYRSFEPAGPWFLIERLQVDPADPQATTIEDSFSLAWGRQIYYMIELIDEHGNISGQETFCMAQSGSAPAVSWPVFTFQEGDQSLTVAYDDNWAGDSDGQTAGDQYAITPQVNITTVVPGPDGNQVTSEPVDPNIHWPHTTQTPPGTIEQHTYTIYTDPGKPPSPAVELLIREVNNFLDTDRHMADLGLPAYVQWQTDGSLPYVRLVLQADCGAACNSAPPVAVFRRIPGGNWMQVTTVERPEHGSGGWLVYDRADLSPDQSYEYTALAFSPTSYEVLGFWQPITLSPLTAGQPLELGSLSPVNDLPPGCQPTWKTPAQANLPGQVTLDNGWMVAVNAYAYGTDGCPDELIPPTGNGQTINNLYAAGVLSNGQGDNYYWDRFYNFSAVKQTNQLLHSGGLLYVDIPDRLLTVANALDVTIEALGFLPDNARAQLVLHLPAAFRFTSSDDLSLRWNAVRGVFNQLTTGYTFDDVTTFDGKLLLVDENLPWFMRPEAGRWTLNQAMLRAQDITTNDRLYYPQPYNPNDATADNNAAFLRVPYFGYVIEVTAAGLAGVFETDKPIEYMPSLPAGFAIASDGAWVEVDNSTISGGYLNRPDVTMTYITTGTVTDLMVTSPADNLHQGVYPNGVKPTEQMGRFLTWAIDHRVDLDTAGRIVAPLALTDEIAHWTGFSGHADRQYLFLAPAIFPSTITTQTVNAPTPAIVAWEQLPNPDLPGTDFDPGLNFIQEQGRDNTYYHCYQGGGSRFDSNMDLYLRRGGVSESLELLLDDNLERVNQHGYIETVNDFHALFVDNAIIEHTMQTKLYLPYPSDVAFDLSIGNFNGPTNCPQAGGFVEPIPAAQHRFWDITHMPVSGELAWQYAAPNPGYYADELDRLPAGLFSVLSVGKVQGISQNGNPTPLHFPVFNQWLPDGDAGRLLILGPALATGNMAVYRAGGLNYALSNVRLNRYHSEAMLPNSRPDSLGLDVQLTLNPIPLALTDASGQITPDSLYACATAGSGQNLGCGFLVLDGRGLTDFFGEVQPAAANRQELRSSLPAIPGLPIVINTYNGGQVVEMIGQPAALPFAWPLPPGYLTAGIDVYFLHDRASNSTLLVGLAAGFEVLPGTSPLKLLGSDLAVIAEGRSGAADKIGLFAGYAASQAALRAIAQRHPLTSSLNWDRQWPQVEPRLVQWAQMFAYTPDAIRTNDNDPVDLAFDTRSTWGSLPFDQAFAVTMPTVKNLAGEAYGLGSVRTIGLAQELGLTLEKGLGFVELEPAGSDYRLVRLAVWAEPTFSIPRSEVDYLSADWLLVELNRDGELLVEADGVQTFLTEVGEGTADVTVLLSSEAGSERFEGGILLYNLKTGHGVDFPYLNLVVGAGQFQNETLFYLAAGGEASFDGYTLGGSLLAGSVNPNSRVLRDMGYGEVLDKFNQSFQGTYDGFYFSVVGEFPLVNVGCLLRATAGFDVRGWYFYPDTYGGTMGGSVSGTVACLISAKGKLLLQLEHLPEGGLSAAPGWSDVSVACTDPDGCMGFAGSFFLAMGVGFDCDPGSWRTWEGRWWGDSWCYTFGAGIGLAGVTRPAAVMLWDYDYDLDYE